MKTVRKTRPRLEHNGFYGIYPLGSQIDTKETVRTNS